MKTKKNELDVDFIGEQNSLTADEEKALSIYFSQQKLLSNTPKTTPKKSLTKRSKAVA